MQTRTPITGTNLVILTEANDPGGNGEISIEVIAVVDEVDIHCGLFMSLHNSAGWDVALANPPAGAGQAFFISPLTGRLKVNGLQVDQLIREHLADIC